MRHDKAAVVIELARRMAGSAEGLTLDDMARDLDVGRRTAERLRDAVLMLFPGAEEVSDPPTKRWRIRGGLEFPKISLVVCRDDGVAAGFRG